MGDEFRHLQPLVALAVVASTACTDAVYVMFTASVLARKRVSAATWSGVWYLLSSFAVITYTKNWVYVCFAALGSFVGAYVSVTLLRNPQNAKIPSGEPHPAGPE